VILVNFWIRSLRTEPLIVIRRLNSRVRINREIIELRKPSEEWALIVQQRIKIKGDFALLSNWTHAETWFQSHGVGDGVKTTWLWNINFRVHHRFFPSLILLHGFPEVAACRTLSSLSLLLDFRLSMTHWSEELSIRLIQLRIPEHRWVLIKLRHLYFFIFIEDQRSLSRINWDVWVLFLQLSAVLVNSVLLLDALFKIREFVLDSFL